MSKTLLMWTRKFQQIPLIIFNNFGKFKGLKQKLSRNIMEKLIHYIYKRRHMSETAYGMTAFFKNNSFIVFKNFNYDQLNVKRMFKGLKWQVVKSLINQVSKSSHMSKTWLMWTKKFQQIPLIIFNNLYYDQIFVKTMLKGLKRQ